MSSGLDWERFGVIAGGDEVCILPLPTLSEKGVGIPTLVHFPKKKQGVFAIIISDSAQGLHRLPKRGSTFLFLGKIVRSEEFAILINTLSVLGIVLYLAHVQHVVYNCNSYKSNLENV